VKTLATALFAAIFSAVVTSAFWIWFYSFVPSENSKVDPQQGGSVVITKGLEVGPAGLAIPVVGIKPDQLSDTFTQARGSGRRHDAIDIMAAEGTPVIAAADGTIEKLFNSALGGITLYERSRDHKWVYYYAHLSAYEPGLHEGQQLKRGQVIARVGHTGDANAAGPHLHFAINQMGPSDRWWNGTPINPYPLLAGKGAGG
jgi:murein DD-endopeptidase MepM/ murein hydrolase activator NlpD